MPAGIASATAIEAASFVRLQEVLRLKEALDLKETLNGDVKRTARLDDVMATFPFHRADAARSAEGDTCADPHES
jgi:hypothetical protein